MIKQKETSYWKYIELFIIFVLVPVSYVLPYAIALKLVIGILGFAYVIYTLVRIEGLKLKMTKDLNWAQFWLTTIIKFITIAVATTVLVYLTDTKALFQVVLQKPKHWLLFVFIYSVFSVYPQELIYRTFFFERYTQIFKTKAFLIFINAILFALAHLFFRSTLVLVITFIGGVLFGITYLKTKSTVLVSIEHAIYGSWLFTVGMGQMLGFPV